MPPSFEWLPLAQKRAPSPPCGVRLLPRTRILHKFGLCACEFALAVETIDGSVNIEPVRVDVLTAYFSF